MIETKPMPGLDAVPRSGEYAPPVLAVVVPSFNERGNVGHLYAKLSEALSGLAWEMIVVDDNSPDGTAEIVDTLSRKHANVRCLRRFGRRGLASACIEGMASTVAPFVAVIDADLQHDERVLPEMLRRAGDGADLVIGSRFVASGTASGGFTGPRLWGSKAAGVLAQFIVGRDLTDPMSGFFLIRREKALKAAPLLAKDGFKILLDLIVTLGRSGESLRIAEVPYQFRPRRSGESKLNALIVLQYLGLWLSKATGGLLPPTFLLFALVGGSGVFVHVGVLWGQTTLAGHSFIGAQVTATLVAMTWNFMLNNNLTYADRKLHGLRVVSGLLSFYAICSLGALANVTVANTIYTLDRQTIVAGLSGALISAVFNYSVTRAFTWR